MKTIEIENIGPIAEFEYAMSGPGLHVLRGRQGAGKSTILRTAQLAVDGRVDGPRPTKRDGTKSGEAVIAGKTLRITKTVRDEGDLTVDGLGDLDIAALHSPKFLDARTRDRHRIAALVRLGGVQADASLFYELTNGPERFAKYVDPDVLKTDDIVEMAARVKRSLEKHALRFEAEAETALANRTAHAKQCEGVDLDATPAYDEAAARAILTAAIEQRSALQQKHASASKVLQRAAESRAKLERLEFVPLEDSQRALAAAQRDFDKSADLIRDLEARLVAAKADQRIAENNLLTARKLVDAAKSNAAIADQLRADIAAAEATDRPLESDMELADRDVKAAEMAVESAIVVRNARAAKLEADEYAQAADRATRTARHLRNAASDTASVLSNCVAKIPDCPLRVKLNDDGDPRLVLATDRSDAEPFDDLSDGEKWPVLLKLAAARNRLIVLPQAAFGELADSTRDAIDSTAKALGHYILTAQADDGELRGEPWKSNGVHVVNSEQV